MRSGNPYLNNPFVGGANQSNHSQGGQCYQPSRYSTNPYQAGMPAEDSWMHAPAPYVAPQASAPNPAAAAQDRYDARNCQMGIARHAVGGVVGGAIAGATFGSKFCPKGPAYIPCVGAMATGSAAFGGFSGGVTAVHSSSCQSITRTHVDQNGVGHIHYGGN